MGGKGERNLEQDLQGAAGNGAGEPGGNDNALPDELHGSKPGGRPAGERGDKRRGNNEVQPGTPAAGGRGGLQDAGVGGPADKEHARQERDVSGNSERGESTGRVEKL